MRLYFSILIAVVAFFVGAGLGDKVFPGTDWIQVLYYAAMFMAGNFVAFLMEMGHHWRTEREGLK